MLSPPFDVTHHICYFIYFHYHHYWSYLSLFGDFLSLWIPSRYLTTKASISAGFWLGTRRMENLPTTFLGITVLAPAPSKAPSIPVQKHNSQKILFYWKYMLMYSYVPVNHLVGRQWYQFKSKQGWVYIKLPTPRLNWKYF